MWKQIDAEGHLLYNVLTGTHFGRSQSRVLNTEGRLWARARHGHTSTQYYCIAWDEL